MKKFFNFGKSLCQDDSGATAIEYGLLAALMYFARPEQVERLVLIGSGSVFNPAEDQVAVLRAVLANQIGAAEADVTAAERSVGDGTAILAGWTHANCNSREAGNRFDNADELRWPEDTVELAKTWREVRDSHGCILAISQDGGNDRGVALVVRREVNHPIEDDIAKSLFLVAGQQAGKNRIAIQTRVAPPHQA